MLGALSARCIPATTVALAFCLSVLLEAQSPYQPQDPVVTVVPGQIVGASVTPNDDGQEYKRLRCHFSVDPKPEKKFGTHCETALTLADRAHDLVNALLWQRISSGANPPAVTNLLDQILTGDLNGSGPSNEAASKHKAALLLHLAVWHVTPNQLTDGKDPRVFSLVHSEWHGFTADCKTTTVRGQMNCSLKESYRTDGSPSFYDTGRVYLVAINEFDSQMFGNRVSTDYKLYELPQEPANLVDLSNALSAISGVQLPTAQSNTAVLSPPTPIDTGPQWQGTDNATIVLNIYQAILPDDRQGPYPVPRSSRAPYSLNADFYLQFEPSPLVVSQQQKLGPAPANNNTNNNANNNRGQSNPTAAQDTSLYLRDHIEQLYPSATASSLCPLPPGLTFKTDIEVALSGFFPDAKFTPVDEPSHCVSMLTLDAGALATGANLLDDKGKAHLAALLNAAALEKQEQAYQYAAEQAYISLQLAARVRTIAAPSAAPPPVTAGAAQNDAPQGLTGALDLPLSKMLLGTPMQGGSGNQLDGAIQAANDLADAYQSDAAQVVKMSEQPQVLTDNETGTTKSENSQLDQALSDQQVAKDKLVEDQNSLMQAKAILQATKTTLNTLRSSICPGAKTQTGECSDPPPPLAKVCNQLPQPPPPPSDTKDLAAYQLSLARYAADVANCANETAGSIVTADQQDLAAKIKAVTRAIPAPRIETNGTGGAGAPKTATDVLSESLDNAQKAANEATKAVSDAAGVPAQTIKIESTPEVGSVRIEQTTTTSDACQHSFPNAPRAQKICTILERINASEVSVRAELAKAIADEQKAAGKDKPPAGKAAPAINCCCCQPAPAPAPAPGSARSSFNGAGSRTGQATLSTAELRLVAQHSPPAAAPPAAAAPAPQAPTSGPTDSAPKGGVVTGIPFRAGDFPLLMTIHSDDASGCTLPRPTGYGPDDNPCIQFVALTSQPASGASPGGSGPGGAGKGGGNNGGANSPGGNGGNNGPGAGNSQAVSPNQPVDCGRQSSASSPCSFARVFTVDEKEWWDVSLGISLPGVKEQILTAAPLTANSLTKTLQTSGNCLSNIYTCTTKHHADAYFLFDAYPFANWYPKETWLLPHFNIGVPLSSQVLYRPYAGTAFNLSHPFERKGFPLSISFMSGIVYMKQYVCTAACVAAFASTYNPTGMTVIPGVPYTTAYPTTGPLPAPSLDRAIKGLFGFEVSISGITSKMKGASGSAGGSSSKSH